MLRSPRRTADIASWAKAEGVSPSDARRRFAQYAVLRAIAESRKLSSELSFKGGNALDLVWHPNRSTMDLDFSARSSDVDFKELQDSLEDSLTGSSAQLGISMRLQRFKKNPPGADRSWPTFEGKIGYAFPDETRNAARIARQESVPTVVPIEISVNEVIGASEQIDIGGKNPIYVCSLEDIVAEKLRAFLQQKPRNRERKQDVLDVAVIVRSGRPLDRAQVARILLEKCAARDLPATKESFRDPELHRRAAANYSALESTTRFEFIPFSAALEIFLGFVDTLPMD